MFATIKESDLIKKANPQTFATNDQYFANYYPGAEEMKKAYVFDGSPAAAADNTSIIGGTDRGNYRNYIYGKQLWAQMNIRPTAFTAIPRNQYVKSGFRIIKEFATPAIVLS